MDRVSTEMCKAYIIYIMGATRRTRKSWYMIRAIIPSLYWHSLRILTIPRLQVDSVTQNNKICILRLKYLLLLSCMKCLMYCAEGSTLERMKLLIPFTFKNFSCWKPGNREHTGISSVTSIFFLSLFNSW